MCQIMKNFGIGYYLFLCPVFGIWNNFVICVENRINEKSCSTEEQTNLSYHEIDTAAQNNPEAYDPRGTEVKLKVTGTIFNNTFIHLSKVKHLVLLNGDINGMEASAFNNLQELESVTFINNRGNIRITEKTLRKCVKLKELVIHLNENARLKIGALDKLEHLEVLSIDNQTGRLRYEMFRECKNLKYLSWTNGLVDTINVNAFDHLDKIEYINLENIQLNKIENFTFRDFKNLRRISLVRNKIRSIIGQEFINLPSFEELNLEMNLIFSINIEAILRNAPRLSTLNLNRNKFTCSYKLRLNDALQVKNITNSFNNKEITNCDISKIQIFSGNK